MTASRLLGRRRRVDQGDRLRDRCDPAKCITCESDCASSCTHFCPGQVYRWDGEQIVLSASNCLHCMTCAVKCPFESIRWQPPEGGEGPRFKQM